MEKPTLPKGTRDFGPAQMAKRQFILDHIKTVFQKYGFQPLETPAMENLSTLTGKYGDEGDQLLFKVLDSGDYPKELRKLLEVDPKEDAKINELLRNFSKDLLSNLNQKKIEFLYKNSNQIENELRSTAESFDFDSSEYGTYLKSFLAENAGRLAREINIEPSKNPTEPLEILLRFVIKTNSVANRIKSEFEAKKITPLISEKGLRYDLTVPFARYVVMNRHEITFPFRRYQIQPVWRADRPQKGRYREFYQCDADVVGTDSLICEAEIILMIKEILAALFINDYTIKINHRGILSGMAESMYLGRKESDLFTALDKLEKVGKEKVTEELLLKGFTGPHIDSIFEIIHPDRSWDEKLRDLLIFSNHSPKAVQGVQDIQTVFKLLESFGASRENVQHDISLARGLSYYTGCIFEVKINNVSVGSVSGGGRYDNLTGVFGMPGVSGVGFSFGVDRIYDAMEELQLFPKEAQISSRALVAHTDEDSRKYGMKVVQSLRQQGIASEIYPDVAKLKKQLEYANKKMVPWVIVIGSEEIASGLLTLKNMDNGEQQKLSLEQILKYDF